MDRVSHRLPLLGEWLPEALPHTPLWAQNPFEGCLPPPTVQGQGGVWDQCQVPRPTSPESEGGVSGSVLPVPGTETRSLSQEKQARVGQGEGPKWLEAGHRGAGSAGFS